MRLPEGHTTWRLARNLRLLRELSLGSCLAAKVAGPGLSQLLLKLATLAKQHASSAFCGNAFAVCDAEVHTQDAAPSPDPSAASQWNFLPTLPRAWRSSPWMFATSAYNNHCDCLCSHYVLIRTSIVITIATVIAIVTVINITSTILASMPPRAPRSHQGREVLRLAAGPFKGPHRDGQGPRLHRCSHRTSHSRYGACVYT